MILAWCLQKILIYDYDDDDEMIFFFFFFFLSMD